MTQRLDVTALSEHLPEYLLERVRVVRDFGGAAGEFVLYWMQTAMRAEENPALDVARQLAADSDLPLLIYQGLSTRFEYASDRHHTFVMQGAADLQRQFASQGMSYAFALERSGEELKQLLARAAVLIVEDMPTDPSRLFQRAALRASSCGVLAVDTACVVPMQLVGRAFERAFEFRNATKKLYKERLKREWPVTALAARPFDQRKLGFTPIDFEREDITELVSACDIDHLVAPVFDTPGGQRPAMRAGKHSSSTSSSDMRTIAMML